MGTPTGYEVLIYELKYADTGVTRTVIYTVFGDATFTSLTLPGGLLQSGGSYVARISARATPGVDFDRSRGSRTVRFSYCGPEADMIEAARRLATFR